MKTIKLIIPIFLGMIMLLSGLTLFNASSVEAQSEGPNCYQNPIDRDCYEIRVQDCICGVVVGSELEEE